MSAGPTFADLCDDVRRTRIACNHALDAVEAAGEALKVAELKRKLALDAEEKAREALDAFIDAETDAT